MPEVEVQNDSAPWSSPGQKQILPGIFVDYVREMNRSYLLLESKEPATGQDYALKMLASNHIPGLLPLTLSRIDQKTICQYEISSLQPLSVFCSAQKIRKADLVRLINSLLDCLQISEDYLLPPSHLLLHPGGVYLDWSEQKLHLAYLPFYRQDLKLSLQQLMEYFLTQISHEDAETAVLAYRIFHELREPNLRLCEIRRLLLPEDPAIKNQGGFQTTSPKKEGPSPSPYGKEEPADTYDPLLDQYDDLKDLTLKPETFSDQVKQQIPEAHTVRFLLLGLPCAGLIYLLFHLTTIGRIDTLTAFASGAASIALLLLIPVLAARRRKASKDPTKIKSGLSQTFTVKGPASHQLSPRRQTVQTVSRKARSKRAAHTSDSYNTYTSLGAEPSRFSPDVNSAVTLNQFDHSSTPVFSGDPTFTDEPQPPQKLHPLDAAPLQESISTLLEVPLDQEEDLEKKEPGSQREPDPEQTVLLTDYERKQPAFPRLQPEETAHHQNLPILTLDGDQLLLGYQSPVCDKVIPDPTVSRIHARIFRRDGEFYLSDLNSRNGTFIEGRQISPGEEIHLTKGLTITFGGCHYRYEE